MRLIKEISVWGTIVWLDVIGNEAQSLAFGIDAVRKYFEIVDEICPPKDSDSPVTKLRTKKIKSVRQVRFRLSVIIRGGRGKLETGNLKIMT
jgi:hypothetical protein